MKANLFAFILYFIYNSFKINDFKEKRKYVFFDVLGVNSK